MKPPEAFRSVLPVQPVTKSENPCGRVESPQTGQILPNRHHILQELVKTYNHAPLRYLVASNIFEVLESVVGFGR